MPDPINPSRGATEPAGMVEQLRSTAGAVARYLAARLELAALEGKEAAGHFAFIAALLIAAVGALTFGYLFLCVAVVFLIAHWTGWPWPYLMLAMALLHIGAAFLAAFTAKERLGNPVFSATLNEIRKDQQWLSSTRTQSGNLS